MQTAQETLPDVLRAAAGRFGEREAVVDGRLRLTYAELHEQVREVARAYVSLGLRPGDRLGIWAPNSWQWQVAALAATYAGGTLVPVNTRYTGHEACDVLARTQARVLVLADGFLGRQQYDELVSAARESGLSGGEPVPGLPDLGAVVRIPYGTAEASGGTDHVVDWPELDPLARLTPLDEVESRADAVLPDDVSDILFTSGTTGRSKGACSAHRQVVSVARHWAECGEVTEQDRYLVVNPFFHSFGYKAGIVVCLLTGATVVPQAVFEVKETLRLVQDQRVSVLPGAPAIYQALLEAPERDDYDTSTLRLAVTGAATVPVALVERMQTELSFRTVLTAYGLTEAVVATMCRPGDDDALVANTCGRAAGLEVRVVSPQGNTVLPPGEEGEVQLRGDNVMLGYLDDAEATKEAVDEDGWLHTGDVGRLDEQGYLKITDRLKDVFIAGGFNVYPAEVEQVLARLDGVVESAVVGVPDDRLGEVGKAYVVRRAGAGLDEEAVVAHAKERLAGFKVPRLVEFVDDLPRNPSGKVLKRALRQAQEPDRSGR